MTIEAPGYKLMSRVFVWGSVVAAVFICWFYYSWYRLGEKARDGYETNPPEQFGYLNQHLTEDLEYSGLRAEWIDSSWANGIRDHTLLFKLSLPPGELERLRSCFRLKMEHESNQAHVFNPRDLLEGNRYLGHSTAPNWWDAEYIDGLPQLVYCNSRRRWRINATGESGLLLIKTN